MNVPCMVLAASLHLRSQEDIRDSGIRGSRRSSGLLTVRRSVRAYSPPCGAGRPHRRPFAPPFLMMKNADAKRRLWAIAEAVGVGVFG
jgi:hypothetical protein